MRALTLLMLLAAGLPAPQPSPVQLLFQYRVSSEDGSAGSDAFRLAVPSARAASAVIWERDCSIGGAPNLAEPPAPSDQFWTFEATEEIARGRRQIRLRYRGVVAGAAKPPPFSTHTIALDRPAPLALHELSARRDCRYDRLTISVSVPARSK
ncbi:MAG TPA: hypothetical protein VFO19_04855 [Vicinamibacterales bacterium]|nr:hypothetical protein [Vicinamibacterales bacterium]